MDKKLGNSGKFLMYPRVVDSQIAKNNRGYNCSKLRSENVSKFSNDLLLARVIDLENTKTAQAQEIISLKLRVKKLEKKGGLKTHKLKRLYKVGRSARIVSSNEASLGEAKIQDKGKAKMIKPEPVKKLLKKDQLKIDEEVAQRLQAEFDEQKDQLIAERLQAIDQEELTIEEGIYCVHRTTLREKKEAHFHY
ncbi:hypothetical protein Tco_0572710 [Tanacetum coccineum]